MKLTKRETMLLYALAFIALNLIAFSFVISPLYQTYLITKMEADTVESDLQEKLNTVSLIGPLQMTAKGLVENVVIADKQQLSEYYADEIDEYLYFAISPFANDWSRLIVGSYLTFDGFDGTMLSYTRKSEVKVDMRASEEAMMKIMREFQLNDKLIALRDIEIVKGSDGTTVSFIVDFYHIRFEVE